MSRDAKSAQTRVETRRPWRRRLAVGAIAIGVSWIIVALVGSWVIDDDIRFGSVVSGDGWSLVENTLLAPVDAPRVESALRQDGLGLSFSVHSGTFGEETCEQPTVRLQGIDRQPTRVSVKLQWRQRGCVGEWVWFTVLLEDQATPFTFEWYPTAEGGCERYEVDGASTTRLAQSAACRTSE